MVVRAGDVSDGVDLHKPKVGDDFEAGQPGQFGAETDRWYGARARAPVCW